MMSVEANSRPEDETRKRREEMKVVDPENSDVADNSGDISPRPDQALPCLTGLPANDIPTQETEIQHKSRVSQVSGRKRYD